MLSKKKRPFECEVCGSSFSQPATLLAHVSTHKNQTKFQCAICEQTFAYETQLRGHVSQAHAVDENDQIHDLPHNSPDTFFYEEIEVNEEQIDDSMDKIHVFDDVKIHDTNPNEPKTRRKKTPTKTAPSTFILPKIDKPNVILTVLSGSLIKCFKCNGMFTDQTAFDQHVAVKHPSLLAFRCGVCNHQCYDKAEFGEHFNRLHAATIQLEACKECNQKFLTPELLKLHMASHGDITDDTLANPTFQCEKCNNEFLNSKELDAHVYRSHINRKETSTIKKPIYNCVHCGKSFQNEFILKTHLYYAHKDRKQIYTHASEPEHVYKCSTCHKTFARKSDRDAHVKTHERKIITRKQRLYVCDICKKAFPYSYVLKSHMFTHSDKKPYVCQHCDKGFCYEKTLGKHIKVRHLNNRYQCDQCHKGFRHVNYLKTHLRLHDGHEMHACDKCHKKFFHAKLLQRHVNIAHAERRFKCDVCQKAFVHEDGLNEHKNTHKNTKPYKCDLCPSRFCALKTRRRHMFSTHGVDDSDLEKTPTPAIKQEATGSLKFRTIVPKPVIAALTAPQVTVHNANGILAPVSLTPVNKVAIPKLKPKAMLPQTPLANSILTPVNLVQVNNQVYIVPNGVTATATPTVIVKTPRDNAPRKPEPRNRKLHAVNTHICNICHREYASAEWLRKHLTHAHANVADDQPKPYTDLTCYVSTKLNREPINTNKINCNECGLVVYGKDNYTYHVETNHKATATTTSADCPKNRIAEFLVLNDRDSTSVIK